MPIDEKRGEKIKRKINATRVGAKAILFNKMVFAKLCSFKCLWNGSYQHCWLRLHLNIENCIEMDYPVEMRRRKDVRYRVGKQAASFSIPEMITKASRENGKEGRNN